MKKNLLLTLSSLFIVTSLAGCTVTPSSSSAQSSDSAESSSQGTSSGETSQGTSSGETSQGTSSESSSTPADPFDAFFENLEGANFTLTDEGYLDAYLYCEDAAYFSYASGTEFGYVFYEKERIFSFAIEDEELVLTGEVPQEQIEGYELLEVLPTAYMLLGYKDVWEEKGANIYVTDNFDVLQLVCTLGSYNASVAQYATQAMLYIEEDGSEATLGTVLEVEDKSVEILLTIHDFGITDNPLVDAYLENPYPYVKPVAPVDYIGNFAEKMDVRNFTMDITTDENPWYTFYGLSDSAFFLDYGEVAEMIGGEDYGILSYEDYMFTFGLDDATGELKDLAYSEAIDPEYPSVYDYAYTVLDCIADLTAYDYVRDTLYYTEDPFVIKAVASMGGYGSYAQYMDGVYAMFTEDSTQAKFISDSEEFEIIIDVKNIGNTQIQGVTDFFEHPYIPDAKTDWTDKTKAIFIDAFGEVIPFYDGFTFKMVEEDYTEDYGMYFITDAGLTGDDAIAYGRVLAENGFIYDEEDSEIAESGKISLVYRKNRQDGSQIIVQSEFMPADELSESAKISFPNGRFQIIISSYVPPVKIEGLDAVNALLTEGGIFPNLPAKEGATFEGIDYSLSASDDWITYTTYLEVTITFDSPEAMNAWQEDFVAVLAAAGFEYDEDWGDYENENMDYVEIGYATNDETKEVIPNTLVVTFVSFEMDW